MSRKLKKVWIEQAKKIEDWDSLSVATKLEWVSIGQCGEVPNVNFLKKKPNLRRVALVETKVKDGDLRAVRNVPEKAIDHHQHYVYE